MKGSPILRFARKLVTESYFGRHRPPGQGNEIPDSPKSRLLSGRLAGFLSIRLALSLTLAFCFFAFSREIALGANFHFAASLDLCLEENGQSGIEVRRQELRKFIGSLSCSIPRVVGVAKVLNFIRMGQPSRQDQFVPSIIERINFALCECQTPIYEIQSRGLGWNSENLFAAPFSTHVAISSISALHPHCHADLENGRTGIAKADAKYWPAAGYKFIDSDARDVEPRLSLLVPFVPHLIHGIFGGFGFPRIGAVSTVGESRR